MNAEQIDCLVAYFRLFGTHPQEMFDIENPLVKQFMIRDLAESGSMKTTSRLFTELLDPEEMKAHTGSWETWLQHMDQYLESHYTADVTSPADFESQKQAVRAFLGKLVANLT